MSGQVQEMFASIARNYDRGNDLLSLGIHRLWRRTAVSALRLSPGMKVLDLCTGTGDLAFAVARALKGQGRVTGLDFVFPMLELAVEKRASLGNSEEHRYALTTEFLCGDAISLPFGDREIDAVCIGFGIRNVDSPAVCLQEIARVLKPGGQVMVLEFGQPRAAVLGPLFRFYSSRVLPLLGGLVTGNTSAYHYLDRTSRVFPCGEDFLRLLRDSGYSGAQAKPLLGGLAYIYTGTLGKADGALVDDNLQMNS